MPKCQLFYDAKCPICTNYVSILRRKINPNDIIFVPTQENLSDFKFVLESGDEYLGKAGIEAMAKRFPVILDYFWMLPDRLRVSGLQMAYSVGSTARKVIKSVTGCGCGK